MGHHPPRQRAGGAKKQRGRVQKWVAAAALFCILVGGALYLGNAAGLLPTPSTENSFVSNSSSIESAQVTDEFVWDGKTYCAASNSFDGNLPAVVSSQEAGPQLGVIQSSADVSLIGCPIFQYAPLGCDAVLIVQRNSRYEVFTFHTFQAYEQNSDVDAQEYLSLYGIQGADGIVKVELLTPEGALLHTFASPEEIQQFYGEYAALKDSSEEYFAALDITHSPSEPGDSIIYKIADSTAPQELDPDADTGHLPAVQVQTPSPTAFRYEFMLSMAFTTTPHITPISNFYPAIASRIPLPPCWSSIFRANAIR